MADVREPRSINTRTLGQVQGLQRRQLTDIREPHSIHTPAAAHVKVS